MFRDNGYHLRLAAMMILAAARSLAGRLKKKPDEPDEGSDGAPGEGCAGMGRSGIGRE